MPKEATSRALRALAPWAILLALAGAHVALALRLDFLSDDAFISFRYARNLARGDGLVFNPGERVEGYTNFLLVVALAGAHRLGADLVAAGRALSLAGGAAVVALSFFLARRLAPGARLAPYLAAALLAVNPYLAAWSGAGLETTLYCALLLVLALVATRDPRPRGFLDAGAVGVLLALTRPEGALVFGLVACWRLAAAPGGLRQRLAAVGPGLALFALVGGAYFAARGAYFGDLLPNTFYVKGSFTWRHAVRGLEYLHAYASVPAAALLLAAAVAGAVVASRRGQQLVVALWALALSLVVLEGGDGLPMYRFLLPAAALGAPLGAAALHAGGRAPRAAVALVLSAALGLSFFPPRDAQYEMFEYQRDHELPRWAAAGRALAPLTPSTTVAAVPIGALAYYSDLRVIDMMGLTDRTIARAETSTLGSGWAGHEKHDGAYVLSRRPDLILLGNVYVSESPVLLPGELPLFGVPAIWAREADVLRNPAFVLYQPISLPVEHGSFLHAYARVDLAERLATRLR